MGKPILLKENSKIQINRYLFAFFYFLGDSVIPQLYTIENISNIFFHTNFSWSWTQIESMPRDETSY